MAKYKFAFPVQHDGGFVSRSRNDDVDGRTRCTVDVEDRRSPDGARDVWIEVEVADPDPAFETISFFDPATCAMGVVVGGRRRGRFVCFRGWFLMGTILPPQGSEKPGDWVIDLHHGGAEVAEMVRQAALRGPDRFIYNPRNPCPATDPRSVDPAPDPASENWQRVAQAARKVAEDLEAKLKGAEEKAETWRKVAHDRLDDLASVRARVADLEGWQKTAMAANTAIGDLERENADLRERLRAASAPAEWGPWSGPGAKA